jgi:hypothetical protein
MRNINKVLLYLNLNTLSNGSSCKEFYKKQREISIIKKSFKLNSIG